MPDLCDHPGALILAERIESYWRQRGYEVSVTTQEAGFVPTMRTRRHDVRSNMVNGLPIRAAKDQPHE